MNTPSPSTPRASYAGAIDPSTGSQRTRLSVVTSNPEAMYHFRNSFDSGLSPASFSCQYYHDYQSLELNTHAAEHIVFAEIAMTGFFDFLRKAEHSFIKVIALVKNREDELLATRILGLDYLVTPLAKAENILRLLDRAIYK